MKDVYSNFFIHACIEQLLKAHTMRIKYSLLLECAKRAGEKTSHKEAIMLMHSSRPRTTC
jgi:hypothetical protein